MKTIIRLTVLLSFLLGSFSVLSNASVLKAASADHHASNDNKNKKRGRRSDDSNSNSSNSNSNSNSGRSDSGSAISFDDARKAAVAAVPGTIIEEEFESKRGRQNYEFHIRNAGGEMYEVYVDAGSGKVIKVDREDD